MSRAVHVLGPCLISVMRDLQELFCGGGGLYTSVLETVSLLCSPALPFMGRKALESLFVGLMGPIPAR